MKCSKKHLHNFKIHYYGQGEVSNECEVCGKMMEENKTICVNGELYAYLVSSETVKDGSEWFGNQFEPLQVSRMKCEAGKKFRIHHHILNPRIIKRTQEAFIVISGKLAIDIYDNLPLPNLIGTLEACPGDAVLVYRGGHGVRVLESGIFYEVKAGQFEGVVSEEKEFRNG